VTFWLSFADPGRPKGTQFLGVAIVNADDFLAAVRKAHALGINPGGEVQGFETPLLPAAKYLDRLLTKEEAEKADASFGVGDA
jgi:hypothetical protein